MVDSPVTVTASSQPSSNSLVSTASLRRKGLALGLAAVGATSAEVLEPALSTLIARREVGLNGDMQFTYRNPVRSTNPRHRMPTAETLVVAALAYGSPTKSAESSDQPPSSLEVDHGSESMADAGRIARYVWAEHYERLNGLLEELAEDLRTAGFRAQVLIDTNHLVDRNAAWRAGLGWYGKNSNLLVPGIGSWVVLGSILTDAPLDQADTPVADGCGPCRHCLDDCPTQAIVAPGVVDARRCIAWLVQAAGAIPVEFRVAVGDRIYGCDDCQEVCPPNRGAGAELPTAEIRADIGWILSADDDKILDRHGRWYIANRDPNVIRRTALVVLGNTAEPSWGRRSVVDVLRRHLDGDSAMLRDHAVWAVRRLGLIAASDVGVSKPNETISVVLPICCDGGEVEQCAQPDLHHELTEPITARFDLAEWLEDGHP